MLKGSSHLRALLNGIGNAVNVHADRAHNGVAGAYRFDCS
jgi:hypothetical protein